MSNKQHNDYLDNFDVYSLSNDFELDYSVKNENLRVFTFNFKKGVTIDFHSHETARLNLMLNGSQRDSTNTAEFIIDDRRGSMQHPGYEHSHHFLADSKGLTVELSKIFYKQLMERNPELRSTQYRLSPLDSQYLKQVHYQMKMNDEYSLLAAEGIIIQMLAQKARTSGEKTRMPAWMKLVLQRIHDEPERKFDLKELADMVDIHPVYLSRTFSERMHCTLGEYVRRLKIKRATELLVKTSKSIDEISNLLGFSDCSHFSRVFKTAMGKSPATWRKIVKSQK